MSTAVHGHGAAHGDHHDHHDHHPTGMMRWLTTTNHKDIGTLYLIFSVIAGLIGGRFSMMMRAELQEPGLQFIHNGQQWNVLVTAHGLVMVFFVVMPAVIGGFGTAGTCVLSTVWVMRVRAPVRGGRGDRPPGSGSSRSA